VLAYIKHSLCIVYAHTHTHVHTHLADCAFKGRSKNGQEVQVPTETFNCFCCCFALPFLAKKRHGAKKIYGNWYEAKEKEKYKEPHNVKNQRSNLPHIAHCSVAFGLFGYFLLATRTTRMSFRLS